MGLIEGGVAVLYAIALYAVYYGIVGAQVHRALIADEEPGTRVFWFFGITFVGLMVWAMVGAVVYWGILIWFRIWLRDPHPWRQEILSDTGWFPFGLILKHGPIPTGGVRGAFVFLGFPFVLLIAAGVAALWSRANIRWERATTRRAHPTPGAPASTKGVAR